MSIREITKDFDIIKTLGKGAYGKVYKVRLHSGSKTRKYEPSEIRTPAPQMSNILSVRRASTTQYYALKVISKEKYNESIGDIRVLISVNKLPEAHKFFPIIYRVYVYKNFYGILLEFIEGISVYKYFRNYPYIGDKHLKRVMKHVLEGLNLLHSHGIAHRDIKDENIIINPRTHAIKIVDFGFACYFKDHLYKELICSRRKGTEMFMSPETFFGGVIDDINLYMIADIWSAGMVFWELAYKKDPPNLILLDIEDRVKEIKAKISSQNKTWLLIFNVIKSYILKKAKEYKHSTSASKPIRCFILSCIEPNPYKRATAKELLTLLKMI